MTRRRLPGPLLRLLHAVIPDELADQVVDELRDDFARRPPGARTAAWLAAESASVVRAYLWRGLTLRLAGQRLAAARDLRQSLRALKRRPVGAVVAAAMLGCGLAAVVAVAALAGSLLFRPLSEVHGSRVVRLAAVDRAGTLRHRFTNLELDAIRSQLAPDEILAAANLQPVVIRDHTASVQALGEVVTAGYFTAISPRMAAGRGLLAGDDRPDAPPVAVIGASLWREHLGGSPSILGRTLVLNTTAFTVVGVSEPRGSMGFAGVGVDVWIAASHGDAMLNPGWRTDPASRWWSPAVLLGSAPPSRLASALENAAAELAVSVPDQWRERRLVTQPGLTLLGSQRESAIVVLGMLGALAALLMVVAAASVGGLWLAGAAEDRERLAVHLALGASRGTLVRRRALEGLLVGVGAGGVAVALYAWARVALASIAVQPAVVLRLDLPLDIVMAVRVLAAGAASGLLLALGPALWAIRFDLPGAVGRGAWRGTVETLPRTRRVLVGVQVALSLALILAAAMFSQGLGRLSRVDAGFDRRGLVAMDFDVEPVAMDGGGPSLAQRALDRVRALPEVRAAAMANRAPVDPSTPRTGFRVPGQDVAAGTAALTAATDGYFETVGIPILAGREFRLDEIRREAPVAIVNEVLARLLWPGGGATGRALLLDEGDRRMVQVIGVARTVKSRSLSAPDEPHIYLPANPAFSLALLARTSDEPRRALAAMQQALDRVGPGVAGFFPRTMDEHLALELLPGRAAARAATLLGAVAFALSAISLYGLVAWFVEVRRREIGLRLALGASPASVRRLVAGQALGAAAPGAAAGVLLAFAVARRSSDVLAGVRMDPMAAAVGLAAVSVLVWAASVVPCHRAAAVDAAEVLRQT